MILSYSLATVTVTGALVGCHVETKNCQHISKSQTQTEISQSEIVGGSILVKSRSYGQNDTNDRKGNKPLRNKGVIIETQHHKLFLHQHSLTN